MGKVINIRISVRTHTLPNDHKENKEHMKEISKTFFESSDRNIVFLSVPIIILSLANSNCAAFNFSAPSTAALMAAILTKLARSVDQKGLELGLVTIIL